MYLFCDTETTNFPSKKRDAFDEKQARVCQIGLILTDENGKVMAEFHSLVDIIGHPMNEKAEEIHGLSAALCGKYGVLPYVAFEAFTKLAEKADFFVAHNVKFDWQMLELLAEFNECKMPKFLGEICTMEMAGGASLADASVRHLERVHEKAHDAQADTRACKDLYFKLKGKK